MPRAARRLALLCVAAAAAAAVDAAEPGTLLGAAKHGTAADVRAVLAAKADPNEADADGTTALHWAVHRGELSLAQALLAAGAKADAANRYGVRPLYLAAENGDAAMTKALLAAGADARAVFAEGETLLMTAARTGDVPTVQTLLAAGADPNATEQRGGQTALMLAAAENNGPAIAALLAGGAERDKREATGDLTALAFAVRTGSVVAARALLDAGADPNATLRDGTSMLLLAAINQNYEVASALLDHGADPNAAQGGFTALHQIALVRRWTRGFNLPGPEHHDQLGSLDLARQLVAHGADVNMRQTAEPRDDLGNPRGKNGSTPFLLATKAVDLPYMRTLLDLGADPKITTDDGTTAVMLAAGTSQGMGSGGAAPGTLEEVLAALELTLELGGGTVNDTNSKNETPLHGAMYRGGATELLDFLVSHGAKLEPVVNSRGWTPLRIADGVALDGVAFIRYPEAADHLRELMRTRGLPVPPVEWDGPGGKTAAK
ncbi:MAG TPA: ankyrin repeat domain-containing protein [Gammaproteobacteria bacterium]|nr:ankyrin repeat domain-containing protein [Gammaproteobacteria bacterium]